MEFQEFVSIYRKGALSVEFIGDHPQKTIMKTTLLPEKERKNFFLWRNVTKYLVAGAFIISLSTEILKLGYCLATWGASMCISGAILIGLAYINYTNKVILTYALIDKNLFNELLDGGFIQINEKTK